jgi:two-component system, chemotaxis family, protein-glutamate methylesterase/glutaminase
MDVTELIEATCPDCRGPLSQVRHDSAKSEYTCLVGHAYSARSLLQAHCDAQERALWAAVLVLEETGNILRAVIGEFPPDVAERLEMQVQTKRGQASIIRNILEHLEPFQTQ